jgi:hypothetical protein
MDSDIVSLSNTWLLVEKLHVALRVVSVPGVERSAGELEVLLFRHFGCPPWHRLDRTLATSLY